MLRNRFQFLFSFFCNKIIVLCVCVLDLKVNGKNRIHSNSRKRCYKVENELKIHF
jgi:hypothetical protein